jgi:hypothetical protein
VAAHAMTSTPVERRTDPRISFEFRTVAVRAKLDGRAIDVMNLGRSGLLAKGHRIPKSANVVHVSIPVLGDIQAKMVWHKGDLVGLSFLDPIDERSFQDFIGNSTGS